MGQNHEKLETTKEVVSDHDICTKASHSCVPILTHHGALETIHLVDANMNVNWERHHHHHHHHHHDHHLLKDGAERFEITTETSWTTCMLS